MNNNKYGMNRYIPTQFGGAAFGWLFKKPTPTHFSGCPISCPISGVSSPIALPIFPPHLFFFSPLFPEFFLKRVNPFFQVLKGHPFFLFSLLLLLLELEIVIDI